MERTIGAEGGPFAWKPFLDAWSAEVLEKLQGPEPKYDLEPEALARGTLTFPGASEEAVAALEARLGTALPASYRAFLAASDGFLQVAMDGEDGKIWGCAEVGWFRDQEPEWLAAWEDTGVGVPEAPDALYYVYGPEQDPVHLRRGYLRGCLAISQGIDSSIYLLNPHVRSIDGEWEAWYFANWLPGANRYRSFAEMMQVERVRVLENLRASLGYRKG